MKTPITYLLILLTAACFGQSSIALNQSRINNESDEILTSESSNSMSDHLPIINTERIWYGRAGGAFEPPYSFRYSYAADSVLIDGNYYFERIISTNEDGSNPIIEGHYREESGILYKSNGASFGESIIIDMTLEEGDMINLDQEGLSNLVVTDVSTIQLNDSVDRKIIYLTCQENSVSLIPIYGWIEGVGRLTSVAPYCALDNFQYKVICLIDGEEEIYTDENSESCWLTTSTKELEKSTLTIAPNPAQNEITVKNIIGDFEYSIFNISGVKVMSSRSNSNQLNITYLPKGLYILSVKNLDIQKQLKFIKS